MEISPGKTSNLHRAPTASTQRPLDGHRASPCEQLARTATPHTRSPPPPKHGAPCVPRVATSPPASSPPCLTTEQLPSACGWCHQPPQGTRTPELLVMSRVLPACTLAHWAPPLGSGVESRFGPGMHDAGGRVAIGSRGGPCVPSSGECAGCGAGAPCSQCRCLVAERADRLAVAGHRVVVVVPSHDAGEPASLFGDRAGACVASARS